MNEWKTGPLVCSSGWLQTYYVAQAGLELLILQPLLLECSKIYIFMFKATSDTERQIKIEIFYIHYKFLRF